MELVDSHGEIHAQERWIKLKGRERALRILEAGCGNRWPLNLDGVVYQLIGVDTDRRALEIREASARAGDEMRYGNLCERERELFPAGSFDAIYNSFVLEHIDGAAAVLENFLHSLAPGGLLILRIPDRDSDFGFLARSTPFWFHVLYKKYVQGMKNAGKPGFDPYPTFHDHVVSRKGIYEFCRTHGLVIREEARLCELPASPPLSRSARACTGESSVAALTRPARLALQQSDVRHRKIDGRRSVSNRRLRRVPPDGYLASDRSEP